MDFIFIFKRNLPLWMIISVPVDVLPSNFSQTAIIPEQTVFSDGLKRSQSSAQKKPFVSS